MYDVNINRDLDGEPMLTLTLTFPEVQSIFSALHLLHDEYEKRTRSNGSITQPAVMDGVLRSARKLSKWELLEDLLGNAWWPWTDAQHDDTDCPCGCTADDDGPYTCNACGDYFETLTEHEAHDCAETAGE